MQRADRSVLFLSCCAAPQSGFLSNTAWCRFRCAAYEVAAGLRTNVCRLLCVDGGSQPLGTRSQQLPHAVALHTQRVQGGSSPLGVLMGCICGAGVAAAPPTISSAGAAWWLAGLCRPSHCDPWWAAAGPGGRVGHGVPRHQPPAPNTRPQPGVHHQQVGWASRQAGCASSLPTHPSAVCGRGVCCPPPPSFCISGPAQWRRPPTAPPPHIHLPAGCRGRALRCTTSSRRRPAW